MRIKFAIALYLGALGMVTYAWWPNIAKLGFVDGADIYGGWDALWQMLPLLAMVGISAALPFGIVSMFIAAWTVEKETDERNAKHRQRERKFEDRVQGIMEGVSKEKAEAKREVEHHQQAAADALKSEQLASAKAVKVREASERAHTNVRQQLKRVNRKNARMKAN